MTTRRDFDSILAGWLHDQAPAAPPAGLHDATMAAAGSAHRAPAWLARYRVRLSDQPSGQPFPRLALALALVTGVVAMLAIAMLGAGTGPRPGPTSRPLPSSAGSPAPSTELRPTPSQAVGFNEIFGSMRYTIPPGSGLHETTIGRPPDDILSLVVGMDTAPRPTDGGEDPGYGGQGSESGNTRGVAIAWRGGAWTFTRDARRVPLRGDPEGFLVDLRDVAGIALELGARTTVGGWPGWVATTKVGGAFNGFNLRVNGPITGLSVPDCCLELEMSYRLIAVDVAGIPLVIQIWARTAQELDAWLPVATEFVDSISFPGHEGPGGSGTSDRSYREVTERFVAPFAFASPLPADLRLASGRSDGLAWVAGANRAPPRSSTTLYTGQWDESGNEHGILILSGDDAWTRVCDSPDGMVRIRGTPEAFVEVLRDRAGMGMGPSAAAQVGGWPAVQIDVDPFSDHCEYDRVHISEPVGLPSGWDTVRLDQPGRLLVTRVGEHSVLVLIWSHGVEDLATWLPHATAIVESIRFVAHP